MITTKGSQKIKRYIKLGKKPLLKMVFTNLFYGTEYSKNKTNASKILIVNYSDGGGGAARQTYRLYKALNKKLSVFMYVKKNIIMKK